MADDQIEVRRSTGEMKFSVSQFSQLDPDAVMKSLLPAKLHVPRKVRKAKKA